METCRQYWWNLNGRCRLNFNWDAIDHDSVVLISASEYRPDGGDPSHSPRFVGDARIRVLNVSPHSPPFDPNHGVTFVVNVDWGSPLHVVTDITVLDAKPVDTLWNGNLLAFTMQHQQQTVGPRRRRAWRFITTPPAPGPSAKSPTAKPGAPTVAAAAPRPVATPPRYSTAL